MLAYTGTTDDVEEVKYQFGAGPDFDRSEWLKVKFTLGLDFPNLPYYIDGSVSLPTFFNIVLLQSFVIGTTVMVINYTFTLMYHYVQTYLRTIIHRR